MGEAVSRPDLGIVGCKQLASVLGGMADSNTEATRELNPSASLSQAEATSGLIQRHSRKFARPCVAGYGLIAGKCDSMHGFSPTCVRRFVEDTQVLGDRSPKHWQQDAFGQFHAWLHALGLRS